MCILLRQPPKKDAWMIEILVALGTFQCLSNPSHRIHVWYTLFTYIQLILMKNNGKYTLVTWILRVWW